MKGRTFSLVIGSFLVASIVTVAYAAWFFDPTSGTGFVGKGDVQLIYGWNNAALQRNAENVQFRGRNVTVFERTWECTNSNNQNIQERSRDTRTTTRGVFETVARERNQITGFNLNGYDGDPVVTEQETGNSINSCPNGPWTLTTPAGDPVEVSNVSRLEVSLNGTDWSPLN